MKRGFVTALVAVAAAAVAACGSSDAGPLSDDSDKQAAALACLTDEKGLDAREDGDTEVVVDGARIRFYLTAAEAEAAQFRGDGEGAEQIGQALLFVEPEVTPGGEELLEDVEACLQDL
jgi:predicted small lipoprotein YifL